VEGDHFREGEPPGEPNYDVLDSGSKIGLVDGLYEKRLTGRFALPNKTSK
jgi:hypothetical protein